MRAMGILSAVLVFIAVFVGVKSLTAFGYGSWDIVVILAPVAILVALFFTGVTYAGLWSVRWLNRAAERSAAKGKGDEPGAVEPDGD